MSGGGSSGTTSRSRDGRSTGVGGGERRVRGHKVRVSLLKVSCLRSNGSKSRPEKSVRHTRSQRHTVKGGDFHPN